GGTSAPVTVTVNVLDINLFPVAVDDNYATPVGQPLAIGSLQGVLSNDIDPDGAGFTNWTIKSHPVYGEVTFVHPDGSFDYQAKPGFENYAGTDSFTYTVLDANGDESNVATVTITIVPVNREPVANDDVYIINKNGTLVVDD